MRIKTNAKPIRGQITPPALASMTKALVDSRRDGASAADDDNAIKLALSAASQGDDRVILNLRRGIRNQ